MFDVVKHTAAFLFVFMLFGLAWAYVSQAACHEHFERVSETSPWSRRVTERTEPLWCK